MYYSVSVNICLYNYCVLPYLLKHLWNAESNKVKNECYLMKHDNITYKYFNKTNFCKYRTRQIKARETSK